MLNLFAALAENERRLIGERTKAALHAKRAAGARLGNPANLRATGRSGRAFQARSLKAGPALPRCRVRCRPYDPASAVYALATTILTPSREKQRA